MTTSEMIPNESATLDPGRQQKAKEYARVSRRLMLVNMLFEAVYAVLWIAFAWSISLRQQLTFITSSDWLLVIFFALIYEGISLILAAPLGFYRGFVLPHRYGMSNQTLKEWLWDEVKGMLISAPIGIIVISVVYAILRAFPDLWWLWVGGFMLLFNVLLSNLAPILIMPLFNKYTPLGEEHADLEARLLRLAERANTKVRGVYKFDMSRQTKSANAGLTGIGNSRRIVLGDTLINEFTPDEIEVVLAHELGHQVHHDIPWLIGVGTMIMLFGLFLSALGMEWGIRVFGFVSIADPAALPLLTILLGIFSLITMPLSNGFSRWRERLADRYALESTGKREAFISAMTRLANQNLADVEPDAWVEWLLHSHPSLKKRIEAAQAFEGNREN